MNNKKEHLLDKVDELRYLESGEHTFWYNKAVFSACKCIEEFFNDELVPEVPQYVADWYEEHKDNLELNLYRVIDLVPSSYKDGELSKFEEWLVDEHTTPFKTLVNMHQFGYVISENKKYLVKLKGFEESYNFLNYLKSNNLWLVQSETNNTNYRTHHTRKQLEDAGFGWVFNSAGAEVKEV